MDGTELVKSAGISHIRGREDFVAGSEANMDFLVVPPWGAKAEGEVLSNRSFGR